MLQVSLQFQRNLNEGMEDSDHDMTWAQNQTELKQIILGAFLIFCQPRIAHAALNAC